MANADMATLWNGHAGQVWVGLQAMLDRVYQPVEERLVAAAKGARSVLDVGCGTGAVTLALARQGARAVGIDLSEPMIELARQRGPAVEFLCADAQEHRFEPAAFDALVSRYGVMFFDDPVRAFANLRRATRPDGRLCAAVWRAPAENPFMVTADRVAPMLPDMPPRKPGAPGQFAWADEARVRSILGDSGWKSVEIAPFDFACTLSADELETWYTRLGPVGVALQRADAATRAKVSAALREAFAPFVRDDGRAHFSAACAIVEARA